jgi:hypothetical protein
MSTFISMGEFISLVAHLMGTVSMYFEGIFGIEKLNQPAGFKGLKSFFHILFPLDFLSCSHHRCAYYFAESISSKLGFYGWKCQSYFNYVFGFCPFNANELVLAGDKVDSAMRGMFLVKTNSKSPFALGQIDDGSMARSLRSDESNIQQDVMQMLRNGFETGKISEDLNDIDNSIILNFIKILLQRNQQASPKVLTINSKRREQFSRD